MGRTCNQQPRSRKVLAAQRSPCPFFAPYHFGGRSACTTHGASTNSATSALKPAIHLATLAALGNLSDSATSFGRASCIKNCFIPKKPPSISLTRRQHRYTCRGARLYPVALLALLICEAAPKPLLSKHIPHDHKIGRRNVFKFGYNPLDALRFCFQIFV